MADTPEKPVVITLSDLPDPDRTFPEDGHRWGAWCYKESNLTLVYLDEQGNEKYEIDLAKCADAREMLDWIMQVSHKLWCSREETGNLVAAFYELLDPQSTVIPLRETQSFDPTAYVKEKIAKRNEGH
jgi:hypothetical protein